MSAPIIIGKWSDAEKVALLLSIIRSLGSTPNWKSTALPAGRTMQATQKMYSELIKTTAGVKMVGGEDITPSRKMPRGGGSSVLSSTPRVTREKKKGNAGTGKQSNGAGASDMSKGKKRARGRGDDIEEDDSGEDELKENDGDDEDEEEGARKKVKPEKTEEIDIFA